MVSDRAKKQALWSKGVEAWFPQGPDSADVVLVQVTPHHAEYWDTKSNKLVQLFSYARSAATGKPPRNILGMAIGHLNRAWNRDRATNK